MSQAHWERLKRRGDNPDFVTYSETNKTNRRPGVKDGKAIGTHTLGRKNVVVAFKEIGPDATPYQLMEKSKKDKYGNWVCPRASETDVEYTREMKRPIPEGEQPPNPFQVYYNAAGGFDRKLQLFGTGAAAPELFTPPGNRVASRHSVSSYSPSLYTQVAAENSQLKEQLSRMDVELNRQKQKGASMEDFLAEKFGWTPPPDPTCSGGPTPGPETTSRTTTMALVVSTWSPYLRFVLLLD